jgi:hypothetical protein
MRLDTEVRGRRRATAIRRNVRHHARGRLLPLCPYLRPLDLRLYLFPGQRSGYGHGRGRKGTAVVPHGGATVALAPGR